MAKHFWLKLHYRDILSDEKMGLIAPDAFGTWVKLLCQSACSPVQGKLLLTKKRRPTYEELARLIRTDAATLAEILDETLLPLGLISRSQGGVLYFRNWRKYQQGRVIQPSKLGVIPATRCTENGSPLNNIEESTVEKSREETEEEEHSVSMPLSTKKAQTVFFDLAAIWQAIPSQYRIALRSPLPKNNGSLVGVIRQLSPDRERLASIRLAMVAMRDGEARAIKSFPSGWKPSFDWLLKDTSNVDKILTGAYSDKDRKLTFEEQLGA